MSVTKLATVVGVFVAASIGWALGGYPGAATGLVLGSAVGVMPWRRRPAWSWLMLWLRQGQPLAWSEPVTVANDGAGGGIRYQDGVAAAAVQLLGKAHTPTLFTGSASTQTDNTLDIADLQPLLRQSLDLTIDSMSVVSAGARRRSTGDYPRVYDTLIGTPPYAGRRETWIIVRVAAMRNAEALQWRTSIGTATLAAAQRISNALRQQGIRARVATATDIVELERRLGRSALDANNQRWNSVRSEVGWLTTYWYHPRDINAETLAQGWTVGDFSRVHIAAEDSLAKRIVIRLAGAGERVTVHSRNMQRWASVRMPDIAVVDQPRPVPGTTVSVVDGTVAPAPRPNTLISIGAPGEPYRRSADVLITQVGPATVEVRAAGQVHTVEIEMFRAENRYVSLERTMPTTAELEPVD